MADGIKGVGAEAGPFEIGRSYDEVGPGLGQLHEAWQVKSGGPALRLFLTDRVEWQPSARWETLIVCEPSPPSVTLVVNQAPEDMPTTELADVLVLSAAAFTRVEGNAQVRAHLLSGQTSQVPQQLPVRRKPWVERRRFTVTLVLTAGALLTNRHEGPARGDSFEALPADAGSGVYLSGSDALDALGYPLPQKPFRNQTVAPCPRRKSVMEINGGCWVTLEHKPPCDEDQAEYKGKCYLPVLKPQPVPRAAEP